MEKQGWVSIWLGNIEDRNYISEYVELTYDGDGESVPSKFLIDFNIDMDEIDEDAIEKVVYGFSSNDVRELLKGCSYEEVVMPSIEKKLIFKKHIMR
ncbi:immunity 22 family protein [Salipaludibacillus agaradhaerens]|uniref:immunity 22 family protein n=1 Tax=Salipaludibacillus agaradhaerens TaxID=76935 RepID=UPI002151987A|nr:immunity 22 family protein [Salipaludibacillus agaradhaerens]